MEIKRRKMPVRQAKQLEDAAASTDEMKELLAYVAMLSGIELPIEEGKEDGGTVAENA